MKLNTKIVILLLQMGLIPLILISFVGYSNTREQITQNIFAKLDAISQIQDNRLQEIIQDKKDILRLFSSRLILRQELVSYDLGPSAETQAAMNATLLEAKNSVTRIISIFLVNPSGKIVASTYPTILGTDVSNEKFFKTGLQQEDISTLKKDPVTKQILSYLAGPLTMNGKTIGVAVIVIDVKDLTSMVTDYTGLGATGETLLAKDDGNGNALIITPTRVDPDAALTITVPKESTDVPAINAIQGKEQVYTNAIDYRGVPVYAATHYVPEIGWGIVVKIDRAEALAPVGHLQNLFLYIFFITGSFIAIIGILIARSITAPIQNLTMAANRLAKGNLSQSVEIKSSDEIGILGQAFNTMASKLKTFYGTLEQRVRDRTNELESEKESLAHAKAKDDALLASIGDGMVATDKDGKIIAMNETAEEMLGYTNVSVIGKKFYDVLRNKDTEGKLVPIAKRPISVALSIGKKVVTSAVTPAYYYIRKDGTEFPVALTVTPVISGGKTIGVIDIFRDITKERDIDKAKTEFVSLASHQLRTPLSVIGWYSEMLLTGDAGKLSGKQKEYLDEIYKGNRRMVNLVNALLNVSRLELGTFTVEPTPTNIISVIESVIKEQNLQVDEKKIAFSTSFAKNVPVIQSDPKLLRIVFQNLLSNAIKYTPSGGKIGISVSLEGKKNVLFAISDNGIGIPKSQQAEIFTKLFRADNARKKDTEGTGLGLYIVKSIVDHAEGKVWFESKEDKGSTFYVTLPLAGMKKKEGTKSLA